MWSAARKEHAMAIQIGNYQKDVIRREPGRKEISLIRWKIASDVPARTKMHDHDVAETTYILEANPRIYQIVDGVKTYHYQGEILHIAAGTKHEVGIDVNDGPALTLNICEGVLTMNTFPSSEIE